ncbi:phage terminase small subunit [Alteribacter populi]|uniref:phage terminase small subunit n=1 Tax=Alteribacter populi TaxID=2011011 RepID=UPI000BBACFDB|nr:phage terminase small subunit [Alteribacter populi]
MAEKHIKAEKDYVKGLKYKEIAEKHGVSINTVKSWKRRYGWNRDRGAPEEKSVHTKNKGAPKGNINAKGNKGGTAPKGNQNAVTHGFFSKFLPAETREIIESMQDRSPADLIYDQIEIQYAAIIRSQNIMYVSNKSEMIKELKKSESQENEFSSSEKEEWEFQFAWDRQATFLNAQSRAMSELRSLIKQFNELAHEDDERRLKLEQMKLSIEKTKAETEKIANDDNSEAPPTINIIDAWSDDDE